MTLRIDIQVELESVNGIHATEAELADSLVGILELAEDVEVGSARYRILKAERFIPVEAVLEVRDPAGRHRTGRLLLDPVEPIPWVDSSAEFD